MPTVFNIGVVTTVPAVAESNHVKVSPLTKVAVAVNVWIGDASHSTISPPELGGVGPFVVAVAGWWSCKCSMGYFCMWCHENEMLYMQVIQKV